MCVCATLWPVGKPASRPMLISSRVYKKRPLNLMDQIPAVPTGLCDSHKRTMGKDTGDPRASLSLTLKAPVTSPV